MALINKQLILLGIIFIPCLGVFLLRLIGRFNARLRNIFSFIFALTSLHLIIIDSADIGAKAGSLALLKPQGLGGISFCTHQLPLQILSDYLSKSLNCKIIIIGIQAKTLAFGRSRSKETDKAVKQIGNAVIKIMNLRD